MKAPNINIFLAQLIIDHLVRRGVRRFCLSPGSRSTPLVYAAVEHPKTGVKVVIDERGSGFYAAGFAYASGQPAAVISTSGTAAVNFYPSVVEAYHSRLPLICLTADRPREAQDCGAKQTIDQLELYGNFARSLNIEAPDDTTDPAKILADLDEKLGGLSSPVQINCRFREPLVPIEEEFDADRFRESADRWLSDYASRIDSTSATPQLGAAKELAEKLNRFRRGFIIAAQEKPHQKVNNLCRLAGSLGWPMVADVISQQRFTNCKQLCAHYDLYLDAEGVIDALSPDMILHVGGLPTSTRINQFLRRIKGIEYIKVQSHNRTIDPDHLETQRVVADPEEFIDGLLAYLPGNQDNSYCRRWMELERGCRALLERHLARQDLTAPSVAWQVGRMLTDGEALFLSNSLPLRYGDRYMIPEQKDIFVGCNRGVSGIDGIIASACGFAAGCRRSTTLIIGDLACMHDINSMKIAAGSEYPIIIVIINNNGGGIFHFLPIVKFKEIFEEYFAAPTDMSFEHAARMFDLTYSRPQTMAEFVTAYQTAKKSGRSAVIEIPIDRSQDYGEHENIKKYIHGNLSLPG